MRLAVSIAVLLAALPAAAFTPYRVADINPVRVSLGSNPTGFASLGGRAIFSTEFSGEVWASDGTAGGTVRIGGGYRVSVVANTGTVIYYTAADLPDDDEAPLRLWVTDGTAAGTRVLMDDRPRPGFSFAFFPVPGTPRLYFSFDDGIHGLELWTSDGTLGGTHLVRDLLPGAAPGFTGFFGALAVVSGKVYFAGEDALGPALFATDGTAAGTRKVFRFGGTGPGVRGLFGLSAFADRLLFYAGTPGSGTEPWISNGTTAGTKKLTEVVPGAASITRLSGFFVVGALAYFVAGDESEGAAGAELWRTNGTTAGTFPLTDFPGLSPFRRVPYDLLIAGVQGRVAFGADDGVRGFEPWSTDGTVAGTRLIRDVCPGPCGGVYGPFVARGAGLYFAGTTDPESHDLEPWVSSLTAAGTRRLKDLCVGECSSFPKGFVAAGSFVYLSASDAAGHLELWRTNGRPQGTVRLTDTAENVGLFQLGTFDVAKAGDGLLFTGFDSVHGWEPWRSDGSRAGTRLLIDLPDPDVGGSYPKHFLKAGARSFFFADDGTHGFELWVSDGTAGGTRLVRERTDGPEPTVAPTVLASADAGGRLVWDARSSFGDELWGSDGTADGTERLLDESVIPTEVLYALGNRVFFLARDEEHGFEPWVTDGTKSGTRLLADTVPGPDSSGGGASPFRTLGSRVLLQNATNPFQLTFWISDGTPEGTVPLEEVYPFLVEPFAELSSALVEMGGKLYFDRGSQSLESRLWVTDLTAAGTREIGAISAEPFWKTLGLYSAGSEIYAYGMSDLGFSLWATEGRQAGGRRLAKLLVDLSSDVAPPTAFSGRLFFRNALSPELWVSNGTVAGTRRVVDSTGAPIRDPRALVVFGNQLICSAPNDLWRTNGNAGGTARVLRRRFVPEPHDLVVAGSRLYFLNFDDETGVELWALRP